MIGAKSPADCVYVVTSRPLTCCSVSARVSRMLLRLPGGAQLRAKLRARIRLAYASRERCSNASTAISGSRRW